MEQEKPAFNRNGKLYALPLIGGMVAGYIVGGLIGISGLAGMLIGAFLIDAFRDLKGTRQLAMEINLSYQQISDRMKNKPAKH